MTTTTYQQVPFAPHELKVGDLVIDGDGNVDNVTAVEMLGNSYRVAVSSWEDEVEPGATVTVLVGVGPSPAAGATLWKGDGSGFTKCTCVYRRTGNGQWERVWNSDPHCTSNGHGADVDDLED